MSDQIDFSAGATLMQLEKGSGYVRGGPIFTGTLASAVQRAMEMSPEDRERASIAVGQEAGTSKTLLDAQDIEALFQRRDFPRA
jgi:hypothetical protein